MKNGDLIHILSNLSWRSACTNKNSLRGPVPYHIFQITLRNHQNNMIFLKNHQGCIVLDIFLHILLPNRASNKEIKVDCALMILSDVSRYYRHALVSLHLASNLITCISFYSFGWDRIGYNFAKRVISSCLIPRLSFVTMKEPTTLRMLKPVSSMMKTSPDMENYCKIHHFGIWQVHSLLLKRSDSVETSMTIYQ